MDAGDLETRFEMSRAVLALLLVSFACLAVACNSAPEARETITVGLGERCGLGFECREYLECSDNGVCEPLGLQLPGSRCILSADCREGHYCNRGVCRKSGVKTQATLCTSTAECRSGLFCSFEGVIGLCREPGNFDVGTSCETIADCAAGLVCDFKTNACEVQYSAPVESACLEDNDCAPQQAIFCDEEELRCGGRGPDGLPIPKWGGRTCPTEGSHDGSFRVLFEVPRDSNSPEEFYRLPFPTDFRAKVQGFATPHPAAVPSLGVEQFLGQVDDTLAGAMPSDAVWLRTSGPPLFCTNCGDAGNPCPSGCMGANEPEQTIFVADITRDADGVFVSNTFTRIAFRWAGYQDNTHFVCGSFLVLTPRMESPWQPGHTYAVLVHSRVKSNLGEAINQDEDFSALLSLTAPDDDGLSEAWATFAPLRDWIATAPLFPSGDTVSSNAIAGGTVFTVRDPIAYAEKIAEDVSGDEAYGVTDFAECDAGTDNCSTAEFGFKEFHGTWKLPNYQGGSAPFAQSGGGVLLSEQGVPTRLGTHSFRFALTIPDGVAPAGGWPIVISSYSAGGSFRHVVESGLAQQLSAIRDPLSGSTHGVALLSITQVASGERLGDTSEAPMLLWENLGNPAAILGNGIQAVGDMVAVVENIDFAHDALVAAGHEGLNIEKIAILGEGAGASAALAAASFIPEVDLLMLIGAAGDTSKVWLERQAPLNFERAMKLLTGDRRFRSILSHPFLEMTERFLAPVDPNNFALPYYTHLLDKHILLILGEDDPVYPVYAGIGLGVRLFSGLVNEAGIEDLPVSASSLQLPARGNFNDTTRGTLILETLLEAEPVHNSVAGFLGSWLADSDGIPTLDR